MVTLNLSGDPLVIPEPQLGRGEQEQTKCSAAANCLAAAATGEHKVECRRGEQQSKDHQSVGGQSRNIVRDRDWENDASR